jgi:hypothetical protein
MVFAGWVAPGAAFSVTAEVAFWAGSATAFFGSAVEILSAGMFFAGLDSTGAAFLVAA